MMCGETGNGAMAQIEDIVQKTTQSYFVPNYNNLANRIFNLRNFTLKWTKIQIAELAKTHWFDKTTPIKKNWRKHFEILTSSNLFGGYLEDRSSLFDSRHVPGKTIHLGIDYWINQGIEVKSPTEGTILLSQPQRSENGGWGGRVDVATNKGILIFGHLEKPKCYEGQRIEIGQILGKIRKSEENRGWSPHLHLQLVKEDYYRSFSDPQEIDTYAHPEKDLSKKYLDPQANFF